MQQAAVPKQQQQMTMMGTDTEIAKRISSPIAIPATAPGVRPAVRYMYGGDNNNSKHIDSL